MQEYLVKDKRHPSLNRLKEKLIKEGLIENRCSLCKLGPVWSGKPLSLHLDHINGDPTDNRLENLRLLCPNCHSQTDTYCGRSKRIPAVPCSTCGKPLYNRKGKTGLCKACFDSTLAEPRPEARKCVRPSKKVLAELIRSTPMTTIGKKYGVSDNAVRKWATACGIHVECRKGYWTKEKTVPPKDELKKMAQNTKVPDIAKHYGVDDRLIHKWFKRYEISGPGLSYWAKKRWEKV